MDHARRPLPPLCPQCLAHETGRRVQAPFVAWYWFCHPRQNRVVHWALFTTWREREAHNKQFGVTEQAARFLTLDQLKQCLITYALNGQGK